MARNFNIRVYGIVLRDQQVLVTRENRKGVKMIKFPGGGLEWGEGLHSALRREFMEEMDIEVKELEHFYTTHFFQSSAFNPNDQLLSVYYRVKDTALSPSKDHHVESDDHEVWFEWLDITPDLSRKFTFPVDQHVAEMITLLMDR